MLGNIFIFGGDAEKEEVRDIISQVVDMVMENKRAKKGFSELLSSETYNRINEEHESSRLGTSLFQIANETPRFCMADAVKFDPAWQEWGKLIV